MGLLMAHCRRMLNALIKFYENILNEFDTIEQTWFLY